MPETDKRKVALQFIASDLERLIRQADANGLPLVGYLLEMAAAEAREELTADTAAKKQNVSKLRPRG